jgi:hypothetical protein
VAASCPAGARRAGPRLEPPAPGSRLRRRTWGSAPALVGNGRRSRSRRSGTATVAAEPLLGERWGRRQRSGLSQPWREESANLPAAGGPAEPAVDLAVGEDEQGRDLRDLQPFEQIGVALGVDAEQPEGRVVRSTIMIRLDRATGSGPPRTPAAPRYLQQRPCHPAGARTPNTQFTVQTHDDASSIPCRADRKRPR